MRKGGGEGSAGRKRTGDEARRRYVPHSMHDAPGVNIQKVSGTESVGPPPTGIVFELSFVTCVHLF
jgi:hypothetical protein